MLFFRGFFKKTNTNYFNKIKNGINKKELFEIQLH